MTNCHKGCSLATNKAFRIKDLCLRAVHCTHLRTRQWEEHSLVWHFSRVRERQKKAVETGRIRVKQK